MARLAARRLGEASRASAGGPRLGWRRRSLDAPFRSLRCRPPPLSGGPCAGFRAGLRLAMSHSPDRRAGGARRARGESAHADDRANIYDEVTQRIVGELEAGRVPWVQPWAARGGEGAGVALPRNAASKRPYSGINVLILWGAVLANGWPRQGWLTFRQAQAAGGAVRKGERGTGVVYADRFTPEAEKERAREAGDAGREGASLRGSDRDGPRTVPFLKRVKLFHVAQIGGLAVAFAPDPVPLPAREIVPVAA